MPACELKSKILSGTPVLGTWSIVASPTLAEIGTQAGYDFHILDLEHGAFDMGHLENAVRAVEGAGGAPLVRVPKCDAALFQSILDLGVHGLIVPQIASVEDAQLAVRYAKFAPLGQRGYNPFTRAASYSAPADNQGGKLNAQYGLIGLIIENEAGFTSLDAIAAVEGIDLIYLGVYDMAVALGCNGNVKDARVRSFVESAAKTVRARGKALGLMVHGADDFKAARALGAAFLVHGVDAHVYYKAVRQPVEALRALVKGEKG